jgi:hypothetical protein
MIVMVEAESDDKRLRAGDPFTVVSENTETGLFTGDDGST